MRSAPSATSGARFDVVGARCRDQPPVELGVLTAGLIVARAIPFRSLCMHHMLPFHGIAHVGYPPRERIIGLSKLGRVVELFARDLQIQERLTVQVADWLQAALEPNGVGVVLEAEHLRAARRDPRRHPHTPGVSRPDDEDIP